MTTFPATALTGPRFETGAALPDQRGGSFLRAGRCGMYARNIGASRAVHAAAVTVPHVTDRPAYEPTSACPDCGKWPDSLYQWPEPKP